MQLILMICQLLVAFGLLNVWLLRSSKATPYRGAAAPNLREEFAAYGLPVWFMRVIGVLKVSLSLLLIVGLWQRSLTVPAAMALCVLMLGAIAMHMKVGDPVRRYMPATAVMIMCVAVAIGQ